MKNAIKSISLFGTIILTNSSLACDGIPYEPVDPSISWSAEKIQDYEGTRISCNGSENFFEITIVRMRCPENNLRVFLKEENTLVSYPVFYALDMLAGYAGFMVQDPATLKTIKATCRLP